eukprot:CAMPEP_0198137096 /NCGR_PEP_ID=MMETSP1443-20131203/648_1 /TAXON_ID=186043 /ORGANISM="Entomoneis sp., Strain CCMP2396" /LENGTH=770 /DNA_ID=CAMNT_0043798427 /DNA_START=56 /DNA_END=2368 /DNA_ORIENTATION=-
MMSQMSSFPQRGQLRYHDFPKLRELHRTRLAQFDEDGTFLLSNSLVTRQQTISSQQIPSSQQSRSFLTMLRNATGEMHLKNLSRQAAAAPNDVEIQTQYWHTLLNQRGPHALLSQMRLSQAAFSREMAMLYLQTLQRTGQYNYLNVDELFRRLQRGGELPETTQNWKEIIVEQRSSKSEQVGQLLSLLHSGMAPAAAGASLGAGASAFRMGSGGYGGGSEKQPLHVVVKEATPSFMRSVVSGFFRIGIIFVGISAIGAMMDSQGFGRGNPFNQNSKHVQEATTDTKVKFDDVKGIDEAKADLEEIVLYLQDPDRFTRLGGKLPRGVLLTGPPGTGKTLLAKAIAGEANVPFFFASGSQFEEVYVGLGAKRIRELFEAAKKKKTAIIFIDEIDAVGGTRKLKDQSALKMTLNELLVQMDGFDANDGIIVIGATNFVESLDEALMRPGRFDKHVTVPLPDVGGRKSILEMYSKKTRLADDVDLNVLARGTVGMSGADLSNLINQAALKASVDGLSAITMSVMEYAKDKILMGAERKTAVITKETARNTAYHEAGHALVGVMTEGAMPIHKATIMPRGPSLGMVSMLPEGDQTSQSKKQMVAMMDVAMGGRVAEELVFGDDEVTSGASNDIMQATRIARAMVTKYGFSEEIGVVYHGGESGEDASSETRALVDSEVKKLTQAAYRRTKALLTKYASRHKLLAETLLEYETLTGDEVRDVVKNGRKPKRPVINKSGGERGDQSVLSDKKKKPGSSGTKSFLPGMGRTRSDSETR